MGVLLVVDDVVGYATLIVQRDSCGSQWNPWIRARYILLVFWAGHHLVEEALEGSLDGRRLRADHVGGVAREGCRRETGRVSSQFRICAKSQPVGAFGGSSGHLTMWNILWDRLCSLPVSVDVHVRRRVLPQEALVAALRIDSGVGDHGLGESIIRLDRRDLDPRLGHLYLRLF